MPPAPGIRASRELKRIAAEKRHLYTRLLANITADGISRRVASPLSSHTTGCTPQGRKYVFTSHGEEPSSFFRSSVCVPLHQRCSLVASEAHAASKEEAELGAVTDALVVLPSPADWVRLARLLDSDLFATFTALLTSMNASAVVRLGRDHHKGPDSHGSSVRFRVTVAVELAQIEDAETAVRKWKGAISHRGAPSAVENVSDAPLQKLQSFSHDRQYDFGVTGDWAPSARDAIKLALFKSLDALENHAVAEWQEAGREGALLLNELRCGERCVDDVGTSVLNAALRGRSADACAPPPLTTATGTWRFRCVAGSESVCVSTVMENVAVASEAYPAPPRAPRAAVGRSDLLPATTSLNRIAVDEVHLPFPVSAQTVAHPFLVGVSRKSAPAWREMHWLQQCVTGAALLFLATEKARLYSGASLPRVVVPGTSAAAHPLPTRSALRRSRLSFFDAGCMMPGVRRGHLDHEEAMEPEPADVRDGGNFAAQNCWHCPDVCVMIAAVRAELKMPARSYPKITFEQSAVHDPARRVRELAEGLYGDVDVLTRVRARWETPRGRLEACAVSDPALHRGAATSPRAWLSCSDTGTPRGPLPLLVAVVCSIYDQAFGRREEGTAVLGRYPTVPVRNPLARGGLDFLLFTWFEASPQVRCFSIGTTPPKLRATPPLDGVLRRELGPSMTRAMLFYDLLGQRVLFAETHAADAAAAVVRVDRLSEKLNCMQQDYYAPPSAVACQAFRSAPQRLRWSRTQRRLGHTLQRCAAVTDVSRGNDAGCRRAAAAALQACIKESGSELGALWTVLGTIAEATAVGDGGGGEAACAAPSLAVCFVEDAHAKDAAVAEDVHRGAGRQRWLGGRDVPWSSRALGRETAPPGAGVMEVRLRMGGTCTEARATVAAASGASGAATAASAEVVLRCRVDALGSASDAAEPEWLCETAAAASSGHPGAASPLLITAMRPASGVLPALTQLCRRALEHLYAGAHHNASLLLIRLLPPLHVLVGWCASAAPLFTDADGGYPPYEARFYAAPKLLGELLQGVAGKYTCSYGVPTHADCTRAQASWGARRSRDAVRSGAASTVASTTFFTSLPLHVDAMAASDIVQGQYGGGSGSGSSRTSRAPAVECTLQLERPLGCVGLSPLSSQPPSPMKSLATPTCALLLGRGVGRTKREAWRSAAWQALRLQFPEVVAQLEAHRDAAEMQQHPTQLNLLARGSRGDWCSDAPLVYKLRFDCTTLSSASTGAATRSRCAVTAVCADGSEVCVLPGHAAAAPSAGLAYVAAVTALRHAVHSAARGLTAGPTTATVAAAAAPVASTLPQQVGWGSAWPRTSVAAAAAAVGGGDDSDVLISAPYATWRDTSHYGKSLWHAYAGALSAHLGDDVVVDLIAHSSGEAAGRGLRLRRRRGQLARVQVRLRNWRSGVDGVGATVGWAAAWFAEQSRTPPRAIASFAAARPATDAAAATQHLVLAERSTAALMAQRAPAWEADGGGAGTDAGQLSLCLLQEITLWLRTLVERCALSRAMRAELRGLLSARASDVTRVQESYRWTLAERVEALLGRWLGRRTVVRIRRLAADAAPASPQAAVVAWVAEALVETHAARSCSGPPPHSRSTPARDSDTHCRPVLLWSAARAVGATSDEAAEELHRRVTAAVRGVVVAEPPPLSAPPRQDRGSPKQGSADCASW
ncbi:hypothetical protein NESM_000433100 [Novymonas esmeraldas]|uniref:Uncharacterized protein n=1 Tax=Novymonas esmeraldas TaxID=1808958 RepID=A0AAW0EN54_9TRYP